MDEQHSQWGNHSQQDSTSKNSSLSQEESNTNIPFSSVQDDTSYTYHWNYAAQTSFDREKSRKVKRKGVLVYSLILTVVFLLCLLLLAGVVIWYQVTGPHDSELSDLSNVTSEVSDLVSPSTVLIHSANLSGTSFGTGFFITSDGYIATNHHVVNGATDISVLTYDGKELDAELVGYYEFDDLAVLKVSGKNYRAVTIGNSDTLRVGDIAIAIGNPGGSEASWTTTQGIISALDRTVVISEARYACELHMMQTDAPVNPGNSGGPLCNANGEVIGVVTRKLTDYEGIGFALPITGAMRTIHAIMEDSLDDFESSVSSHSRPTIGITIIEVVKGDEYTIDNRTYTATHDGLMVIDIVKGSGAYGHLKLGDVLIGFDGETALTMEKLQTLLYDYNIGDSVEIDLIRNGSAVTVNIRLGVAN